jgi:heme-binding NEAT domain protein
MSFLFISDYRSLAEIDDGTYLLNYEIIHAETESASIANDYFEKPAILFVKDGEKFIRFTVNHSNWIQEIEIPMDGDYIDVEVKQEDEAEDMRDVVFKVEQESLSEPMLFKMHVIVKEVEPNIDSHYTARFQYDIDNLEPIADSEFTESDLMIGEDQMEQPVEPDDLEKESADAANPDEEDAESGAKSTSTFIIIGVIIMGTILIIILRNVFKRKNNKGDK